jgi:hypothetical protein
MEGRRILIPNEETCRFSHMAKIPQARAERLVTTRIGLQPIRAFDKVEVSKAALRTFNNLMGQANAAMPINPPEPGTQ